MSVLRNTQALPDSLLKVVNAFNEITILTGIERFQSVVESLGPKALGISRKGENPCAYEVGKLLGAKPEEIDVFLKGLHSSGKKSDRLIWDD